MSEARIDDLLDAFVAPFESRREGWDDVLERARRTRRRYVVVTAAFAALIVLPAALAFGGRVADRVADLFHGTPAPPEISTTFDDLNKRADISTREGFATKYPRADVAKAHGVIQVQTRDGAERLWAAPNDQGGQCWFIDFANDPPGPTGKYGFGGCDTATPPASKISFGTVWVEPHPSLVTVWGRVFVPADRVDVKFEDGSRLVLPVVEGSFLASLDGGEKVAQIPKLAQVTAYDTSGEQVAKMTPP